MRIIAGEHRGRTLASLAGEATRPTTDRVREALMSSIYSARGTFEGAYVLDAFAGSGALGLEVLSRGAAFALLCEQSRDAARTVQRNIDALGLPPSRVRLRQGDAFTLPKTRQAPFDLLFLDPPYAYEASRVLGLVAALDEAGMVSPGALVCYEHAKKDKQSVEQAVLALEYGKVAAKDYGGTSLVILRKAAL